MAGWRRLRLVEVKLKSGRTRWVNTDEAEFNGMDTLGPSEEK